MSQLKRILQIASAAGAISFCLNSTSASALTLTLGSKIIDNGIVDLAGITSLPFNELITDANGNRARVKGLAIAVSGDALVSRSGADLGGVILNITQFSATAAIDNASDFNFTGTYLKVEQAFQYEFDERAVAQQVLTGNFDSNSDTTNVSKINTVTFSSAANNDAVQLGQLTSNLIDERRISIISKRNSAELDNEVGQLNNPIVVSQLKALKLAKGQTFNLPNSACFVLANTESISQFNSEDAENSCKRSVRSVPEPSSALSMLALSLLGTSCFLLRRKTKLADLNNV